MTSKQSQKDKKESADKRTDALVRRVRWIILGFGALAIMQAVLPVIKMDTDPGSKALALGAITLIIGLIFAAVYFLVVFLIRRYFSKLFR